MGRSIPLRTEPSLRQAKAILARLERELAERGAVVEAVGSDALQFRMPYPWQVPKLSWLLPITSGRAGVSAGGGGPWKVRFKLHFSHLQILCGLLSVILVAVGWRWPRLTLLNGLVLIWLAGYLLVSAVVSARFARLLRVAARDVIERRKAARASGDGTITGEGPVVVTEQDSRPTPPDGNPS